MFLNSEVKRSAGFWSMRSLDGGDLEGNYSLGLLKLHNGCLLWSHSIEQSN